MWEEEYFEFEERTEEPEELDFKHLKPCPHCHKPIPQNALFCLYCGQNVYRGKTQKKIWLVVVALLTLISFLVLVLR